MTDRQKAYLFLLAAVVFFHAMTALSYFGAFDFLNGLSPQAPAEPPPISGPSIRIDGSDLADLGLAEVLIRLMARVLFPFV